MENSEKQGDKVNLMDRALETYLERTELRPFDSVWPPRMTSSRSRNGRNYQWKLDDALCHLITTTFLSSFKALAALDTDDWQVLSVSGLSYTVPVED